MGEGFYKVNCDTPARLGAALAEAEKMFEVAAKYFGEVETWSVRV
jgi:hypothetical protein